MIPASEFRNNIVAQLHYATALGMEEALLLLENLLASDDWAVAPSLWIETARAVDQRTGQRGAGEALVARLARRLVRDPIGAKLHDFLPQVFTELVAPPATAASMGPTLDPLVGWLAQGAKAGDAGLVASVLEAAQQISLASGLSPASIDSIWRSRAHSPWHVRPFSRA